MNGLALCAGIGGLELGLKLALRDYRCVGYCERDAYAASVLVARIWVLESSVKCLLRVKCRRKR